MASTQRTSNINRRQFLKTVFAAGTAGFLLGGDAEAWVDDNGRRIRIEDINWGDPLLTTDNIGFHERARRFIGPNRSNQVTPQEFTAWLRNKDRAFRKYEEFTGTRPNNSLGRAGVALTLSSDGAINEGFTAGTASGLGLMGYNNTSFLELLREVRTRREPTTFIAMHELAHLFHVHRNDHNPHPWSQTETAAELIHAYAMENDNFEYSSGTVTERGAIRRQRYLNVALNHFIGGVDNLIAGRDSGFNRFGARHDRDNLYNLYMFGLPDVMGWDTMSRAVRSYYQDSTFVPTKMYTRSGMVDHATSIFQHARSNAHEFADRVAFFHDEARNDPERREKIPNTAFSVNAQGRPITPRDVRGERIITGLPEILLSMPRFRRNLNLDQQRMVRQLSQHENGLFAQFFEVPLMQRGVLASNGVFQRCPHSQQIAVATPQPATPQPPVASPQRLSTPTVTPPASGTTTRTDPNTGRVLRSWTNPNL